jgi:predicted RNA-binding Zn ribbon-like protein
VSYHEQGPGYKECPDCNGAGTFDAVVGESQGRGGIEPIEETQRCLNDGCTYGFVERSRDEMIEELEMLRRKVG